MDATIVLTAAVSSGVAAYRFAPFAATCDSHCSSASAIVSGRVDRPDEAAARVDARAARRGSADTRDARVRARAGAANANVEARDMAPAARVASNEGSRRTRATSQPGVLVKN